MSCGSDERCFESAAPGGVVADPCGLVGRGQFRREGFADLDASGGPRTLRVACGHLFYFPGPGLFAHYPPSATKKGRSVGFGAPGFLKVLAAPTAQVKNLRDWSWLSQVGSNAEVLQFLRTQNLLKIKLALMCWRFQPTSAHIAVAGDPKAFFRAATSILRERLIYDPQVWSFAFVHRDMTALAELLQRSPGSIAAQLGSYFSSSLVSKDAAEPEWSEYTHLEYSPLLNARAHTLRTSGGLSGRADNKKALSIQNMQLEQQYASCWTT